MCELFVGHCVKEEDDERANKGNKHEQEAQVQEVNTYSAFLNELEYNLSHPSSMVC